MTNDLVERYIYAIVKNLPHRARGDVEQELRSLVDDMLEARCGELPPGEKDVRVVLTELGAPAELAEKYSPDAGRALIGPAYYGKYKFVLKIVLACVVFGLLVSGLITMLADPPFGSWWGAVFEWIGSVFGGVVWAFAFVTLIFAFFEHKKVPFAAGNSLDDLPPVPQKSETFSRGDAITGIVFAAIFAFLFLAIPQYLGYYKNGVIISAFNVEYLRSAWWIIALLALIGILREVARLFEGSYTVRFCAISVVCSALSAVLALALFLNDNVLNPAFLDEMILLFDNDQFFMRLFRHVHQLLAGVVLFALCLDIGTTLYKTLRYKKAA